MAVILTRQKVLAAKVESTKGTAETLSASDAGILVEDVTFSFAPEEVPRNPLRDNISTLQSIPGARIATITFRAELKGSGTDTTPPSWGVFLKGCGFSETVGASDVTYTPETNDADTDTLTIAVYTGSGSNTRIHKMYGARGSVSFEFNANNVSYANFTFSGIYSGVSDGTQLSPTYESTVPVPWYDGNVTWNFGSSYSTAVLSALTIDLNNDVVLRENANASTGLSYAVITGRDPGGSIDPDAVLVATQDWYSHMLTPTTGSFSFDVGSSTGNKLSFSAPKFQVVGLDVGDRDSVMTDAITFKLRGDSGDDELTITHS